MLKEAARIINHVRRQKPLVQAITNYVTINDCANILISFGASPAMCEAEEEVQAFIDLAGALYVNIGTLTGEQKRAIPLAIAKACELNKPVVIDPVGVGAISSRIDYIMDLLTNFKISAIKGNLGEIKVLAGIDAKMRGVDSLDSGTGGIEACKNLAERFNLVVVGTGPQDIITDGKKTVLVENGSPMLTLISGAGCMLGALITATAAVENDTFKAALAAVLAMGIAGELSTEQLGNMILPGTFRIRLFDNIHKLAEEVILQRGQIK